MNRTRVFIVAVLSAAALLVVGTLVWRTISGDSTGFSLASTRQQMVRITVITAQPVEPWVPGRGRGIQCEREQFGWRVH